MAFLIHQIKEQKILEMEVDFNDFIEKNKISESAIIHSMVFDKEVFVEEKEVREYLKDKYMFDPSIFDDGTNYIAELVPMKQIDIVSEIQVELRRGVIAHAGDLIPIISRSEIEFNTKGVTSLVNKMPSIELNEGLPYIIEIAKVAKGYHPRYGEIELTQDNLESFVKNFDSGVTTTGLAVNEDHKKNEAFGWFKEVFLSYDKQTLFANIQWNTKGNHALSEKEYRYFSPEFNFNYVHELTQVEHGATLVGGALTNYPFLKMNALVELNNKNKQKQELIVEVKTIDLSVHNAQVVDLNGKINNMQVELNSKISENKTLSDEVETLKETINMNAKKVAHQKLFDTNKINAAQLECLNRNGDVLEFAALADTINLDGKGADGKKEDTVVELNDGEKKVADSLGLSHEEFQATKL